jgi:hypothetical protein
MLPLLLIAFLTCQLIVAKADEMPTFDFTSDLMNGADKATEFLARERQVDEFHTIEIARLEIDIAHAQRTPGVRQRPSPSREVTHYTKIIMRNPKDDNAYFRRGIANLYAGALPRALSDMVHASELDRECSTA